MRNKKAWNPNVKSLLISQTSGKSTILMTDILNVGCVRCSPVQNFQNQQFLNKWVFRWLGYQASITLKDQKVKTRPHYLVCWYNNQKIEFKQGKQILVFILYHIDWSSRRSPKSSSLIGADTIIVLILLPYLRSGNFLSNVKSNWSICMISFKRRLQMSLHFWQCRKNRRLILLSEFQEHSVLKVMFKSLSSKMT